MSNSLHSVKIWALFKSTLLFMDIRKDVSFNAYIFEMLINKLKFYEKVLRQQKCPKQWRS